MTSAAVVVCTWHGVRGEVPEEAEAALTLGRKVSGSLGADLHWLAVGPTLEGAAEIAQRQGVAALERIEDPMLDVSRPDAFVEALAQYCATRSPKLLLFNQTFDTRLVVARLAGRLGSGVVMNGVDVEAEAGGPLRVTAAAYGGDTRVVYELAGEGPCLVALLANAVLPEPAVGAAAAPTLSDVAVDLSGVEERIRVVEAARTEGPRLEDAEVIVAGGRGLGSPRTTSWWSSWRKSWAGWRAPPGPSSTRGGSIPRSRWGSRGRSRGPASTSRPGSRARASTWPAAPPPRRSRPSTRIRTRRSSATLATGSWATVWRSFRS